MFRVDRGVAALNSPYGICFSACNPDNYPFYASGAKKTSGQEEARYNRQEADASAQWYLDGAVPRHATDALQRPA
tara:strand:- start:504 stop:728 length:225 start_codon:yes stop_codon:yes gene_type:complete